MLFDRKCGLSKDCLCVCVQSFIKHGVLVALSSNLTKDTKTKSHQTQSPLIRR